MFNDKNCKTLKLVVGNGVSDPCFDVVQTGETALASSHDAVLTGDVIA